jgi:hypothetical protein
MKIHIKIMKKHDTSSPLTTVFDSFIATPARLLAFSQLITQQFVYSSYLTSVFSQLTTEPNTLIYLICTSIALCKMSFYLFFYEDNCHPICHILVQYEIHNPLFKNYFGSRCKSYLVTS